MTNETADRRKFVIGWLTLKPGKRDEFMEIAVAYIEACRKEPGCLFFEMCPSPINADEVTIMECFQDVDAHALHLETPEFKAFWPNLNRLGVEGRFQNIYPDRVVPDLAVFGGPELPDADARR